MKKTEQLLNSMISITCGHTDDNLTKDEYNLALQKVVHHLLG